MQRSDKRRESPPQLAVALLVEQQAVDGVVVGHLEQIGLVGRLLAPAATDHPERLVARGRREPRPEPLRLADPVEVLDEPEPRRLGDVGRVLAREPVRARGRPDEPREAVDDRVPGELVAGGGLLQELAR